MTNELLEELRSENCDLDAIEKKVTELEEQKALEEKEIEERKKQVEEVLEEKHTIETFEKEEVRKTMSIEEIRNSKEYIDAFAEYVKTGDDKECRALLTENAPSPAVGTVPVPTFVYELVKTNWERSELFGLIRKAYVKGNLKVGIETARDPAQVHNEGASEITEEQVTITTVNLIPFMVKKWLSISDELYATSEEMLRFVYDEITHRIIKKVEALVIAKITNASAPYVTAITQEQSQPISQVLLNMMASVNSSNPVIVLNRMTWALIKGEALSKNFAYDPFFGMRQVIVDMTDNAVIVGDFAEGFLANFPEGDDVKLKFDDLTLATSDLIRVIGRLYVALDIVNTGKFAKATISGSTPK